VRDATWRWPAFVRHWNDAAFGFHGCRAQGVLPQEAYEELGLKSRTLCGRALGALLQGGSGLARQQASFGGHAVQVQFRTGTELAHQAGAVDVDGFLSNA